METDLLWLDWATGTTSLFVNVETSVAGNRLNDGRCDHAGRYIVGTMHPVPDEGHAQGSLYSISPDGAVDGLETGVMVPNGLAFDHERGRMYWIDSPTFIIWIWDYDFETGIRTNKRVFFDYSAHSQANGTGDGGCLDEDGYYWSASVFGWALTRISPEGQIDRIVPLPVQKPSMPAFGGADFSTLFVTTIGEDSEPGRDGFEPGALLSLDVGVKGLAEPTFVAR
jgi:sugar lactone lactonase YvrE